jgi:peptide subunit release factor 1 (eRF1)
MAENSTRHIDTLREMEAYKRQYQIQCSHYELEFSMKEKRITCAVCGKAWAFVKERGYSDIRQVFSAERDDYIPMQ